MQVLHSWATSILLPSTEKLPGSRSSLSLPWPTMHKSAFSLVTVEFHSRFCKLDAREISFSFSAYFVVVGLGAFPLSPRQGEIFCLSQNEPKNPLGHHTPRKTVTLGNAGHACPRTLPCRDCRAAPAAASRGARARPARRPPTRTGHSPSRSQLSHPQAAAGHKHPGEGTNTSAAADAAQDHPRGPPVPAGLREQLPPAAAAATAPPQSRAAAPKRGQKKFWAGSPGPGKGQRRRAAASPPCPPAPHPRSPPRAPRPYTPRHGIPSAAPLQPPAAPAAALRRSALGRSGPGPALPTPPPAPRTAGLPTATAIAVRCLRCAAARRLCAAC